MGFDDLHPIGHVSREQPDMVWNGTGWEPHNCGKFDPRFKDKWPLLKRRADTGKWTPHLFLFVSSPMYDGTGHNTYVKSIVETMIQFRAVGVDVQFSWPRGDGIARSRNRQIAEFLMTPATHLVCIDADIGFQPQHLMDMVTSYLDVVFGAYPAKGLEWQQVIDGVKAGQIDTVEKASKSAVRFVVNFDEKDIAAGVFQGITYPDGRGFVKLKEGSTGFMVIRRKVIEKLIAAYPERAYQDDYPGPTHGKRMYDLFHMGMDPSAPNELAIAALKKAAIEHVRNHSDMNAVSRAVWEYARTHQELSEKPETLPRYLSEDYGFCRLWTAIGGEVHVYTGAHLSHAGQYVYEGAFSDIFKLSVHRPANADNAPVDVKVSAVAEGSGDKVTGTPAPGADEAGATPDGLPPAPTQDSTPAAGSGEAGTDSTEAA